MSAGVFFFLALVIQLVVSADSAVHQVLSCLV